jgi:hypothetical protein
MHRLSFVITGALAACALGAGCSSTSKLDESPSAFSSNQATLLDFEFDGEVEPLGFGRPEDNVLAQMYFTLGHLNADNSVARLDKMTLSFPDGLADGGAPGGKLRYHVKLPVAWGTKKNFPTHYELTLPVRVDSTSQSALFDKVKDSCIEPGAHDPDAGSFFFYYRPHEPGCTLDPADVMKATAKVTVSPENTKNKFPEYDKVWEDNALKVVAIFGKFESGKTADDPGIDGYNEFIAQVRASLGADTTTVPANLPDSPGVGVPDATLRADLGGGRSVEVVALLVDNLQQVGPDFDKRYGALSTDADLITYNGHSGLGANIRALGQKGEFKKGKYQIFFENGCDSFAYVDGFLAKRRALLNPDDPTGTKYMEFITNVMPAFFSSMPSASMALVNGLKNVNAPEPYDKIFEHIDNSEVVVVTGEEDNVFQPH